MQNEMADKLDILMNMMFEYIKKACYNEGMSCKTDVDLPTSRISCKTHVDNLDFNDLVSCTSLGGINIRMLFLGLVIQVTLLRPDQDNPHIRSPIYT
jgi:hypothetical protein